MSDQDSPQAPPPQAQLMQMAFGFTVPFLLRAAAQLCIADHLADGAKTAEELARLTKTHAASLYRLMRTLASLGLLHEDVPHRFALTPLGEPLRSNVPGSVRNSVLSITGDLFIVPWSKLAYSAQTGQPSFDHFFGAPFFEKLETQPDEAAWFHEMLIGLNAADAPAVAASYDFTPFAHVVDVGGATGHMLTTILASHAGPRGTIFDLVQCQFGAAELIKSRGMAERVSFVPGSFFENIPAGCDLYVMSHVIHDWSEEQCLTILANCHRAMPATARLLIIEQVLPEGDVFHRGKILDMNMLVQTPGQDAPRLSIAPCSKKPISNSVALFPPTHPSASSKPFPLSTRSSSQKHKEAGDVRRLLHFTKLGRTIQPLQFPSSAPCP